MKKATKAEKKALNEAIHQWHETVEPSESDDYLVFENTESARYSEVQACNSIQYFAFRNLVWVAAITLLDFDEVVTPEDMQKASDIAFSYREHYSRGDELDTLPGVDRPAETDQDGRAVLQEDPSMDTGGERRIRLSEKQFDILSSNADRYVAAIAALTRRKAYGIEPNQPGAETMQRVIDWHRNYILERQAQREGNNQRQNVAVDNASHSMGQASLGVLGVS
jgi:hypothetical protein